MKSGPRRVTAPGVRLCMRPARPHGPVSGRPPSPPPRQIFLAQGTQGRRRGGQRTVTKNGQMFSTNSLQRKVFHFRRAGRKSGAVTLYKYLSFLFLYSTLGAEPGNGHYNTMSLFFVRYPDVASLRTCLFVHNSSLCVSCFIGPTMISSVQVI